MHVPFHLPHINVDLDYPYKQREENEDAAVRYTGIKQHLHVLIQRAYVDATI